MLNRGDRVYITSGPYFEVGPYAGMWATVVKSETANSYPLTTLVPDGDPGSRVGYTVKTARLVKGSTETAIAIRPRGVVAIREV